MHGTMNIKNYHLVFLYIFSDKNFASYEFSISPMHAACPVNFILNDLIRSALTLINKHQTFKYKMLKGKHITEPYAEREI